MCGIVGVYGHSEAANITYLGLHALQHRGQEATGIVTYEVGRQRLHEEDIFQRRFVRHVNWNGSASVVDAWGGTREFYRCEIECVRRSARHIVEYGATVTGKLNRIAVEGESTG